MTSFRCLEFLLPLLLLLLLLQQVHSEEPEPVFRAQGSVIEMGYCFGVDYIVVYRCAPEGDQLLGNSSANATVTPPADLRGRLRLNLHDYLLGLQIRDLTHVDSGFYRRECWQNQTLVNHLTQQLSVCDEEVESEEIVVEEEAGVAQVLCNSTSTGLEGTSVRWYYEMYPHYKLTLFLDTKVSLEPLVEELRGVLEVKDRGAMLVVPKSVLKTTHHFHCLVSKGENCLSFQNMYLPGGTESRDVFASHGDRVVLHCPSDGDNQQWETPLGMINDSSTWTNQMHLSVGDKSEDFSLVIPAVSDEHRGDYTCVSTSLEMQYSLALCPMKKQQEKMYFKGGTFSLECKTGQGDSQRVQWYHAETSGEYKLLHDSNAETVPIPEDLRDRLTLSDNGSSLTISNVEEKDAGLYWCVVLGPEEEDDNYTYEYDEGDAEENDLGNDQYIHDASSCILKQETLMTLGDRRSPTAAPPETFNTTAYAVGAVVLGLLVVGAIVAGIAIKKKKATSRSGLNADMDIGMNEHPNCATRLTSEEDGA